MTGRNNLKVTAFDSIAGLTGTLGERANYATLGNTFLCSEWLKCLDTTVLSKSLKPRLYVASNDAGPTGLLACGAEPGSSVLRAFTNYYSQDYRPTLASSRNESSTELAALIDATVDAIADDRPRWQQIDLDYLRSDRPDIDLLVAALGRNGFKSIVSQQYENWYLTTEGQSFETYFAARSSQLRNTITRKEKKIKKAHALDIKIYTQNDEALTKAIGEYIAIYNSSWKNPEPYPDFIPTFARMCADLGTLRLGVAYLDGTAAAAQFWITGNSRSLIYKLAYDERFAELSVGAVLSRELFKQSLDIDRVAEIDYGIGSEPYKKEWMSGVRNFKRLTAYNLKSIGGNVRFTKRAGGAAIKRVAQRLRPSAAAAPKTAAAQSK